MAVNPDPIERPDNTKLIAGNEGIAIDQDPSNGQLLAALTGNEGLPIDQDGGTGQLLAELTGSEGLPIDQDTSGQLVAQLLGNENVAIDQDPEDGQLLARFTGNEGLEINQEIDTGKLVSRIGGAEGETDVNLGTLDSPADIVASGGFNTGARNTGGAEAIAGDFISDDGNAFNVEIDWLDGDGNAVKTHSPAPTQGVTEVQFAWRVRSDRWQLRVEDASGAAQNNVRGSANTH